MPGDECFTEHPDLLETRATHELVAQVRCHIPPERAEQILLTEIRPTL